MIYGLDSCIPPKKSELEVRPTKHEPGAHDSTQKRNVSSTQENIDTTKLAEYVFPY